MLLSMAVHMKIIDDRPPNFEDILKVFPEASRHGIVFAYGDKIYAPGMHTISQPIVAHESVHGARQLDTPRNSYLEEGPEAWWTKYLIDPQFRFNEELLAHQAEYQSACMEAVNRKHRKYYLKEIAKKLSSSLYGSMITTSEAMKQLKRGEV